MGVQAVEREINTFLLAPSPKRICIFVSFHSLQVLVLVPTRELATQVARDFKSLTRKLSVACFYGGTPYKEQRK